MQRAMLTTKVPLQRLASLSLTRTTGMQMKYASAALKPFYSDTNTKKNYVKTFLVSAGCVPMWGMGFFINGNILAELGASSSYLAIFGGSFVISVTSMVVVIYQIIAGGLVGTHMTGRIIPLKTLQIRKYDTDENSTKFQLTTWKDGDIVIDTKNLKLIPRLNSLQFELQDKENLKTNPVLSTNSVTNKPMWNEFTSTIPIDLSLKHGPKEWHNLPKTPFWEEQPTFRSFMSSVSSSFEYTCFEVDDEKYIIPNLWLCQGGDGPRKLQVKNKNILLCKKCSMTWNLDELSLPIRSENGTNSFQLLGKEHLNPEKALLHESIFRSILDTNKLPSKCLP